MFNKKKSGIITTALAIGMFIVVANGAKAEGVYVAALGGYATLNDASIGAQRDDLSTSLDAITLEDSSALFGGSIGYNFDNGFRLEGEVTHQGYDVEKLLNAVKVLVTASGDVDVFSAGINAFYDIKLDDIPVTPYIGAGLGAVYLDANDVKVAGRSTLNEGAVAPTAAFMLGLGFDLTDSIMLSAGYRLQGIGYIDGSNTRKNGSSVSGEADAILIHSGTVGIRYGF